MTYRNACETQYWPKEQMDAYWAERIAGKRPDYLKKAEEKDAERFSKAKNQKVSSNHLGRPSKQQVEAFFKQGLTDQHIIDRYPHLPADWLQEAKRHWGME